MIVQLVKTRDQFHAWMIYKSQYVLPGFSFEGAGIIAKVGPRFNSIGRFRVPRDTGRIWSFSNRAFVVGEIEV